MSDLTYQVPPELTRPFRTGEVVAVCNRNGETMSRLTVERAGKKVIRLEGDARRFRASDGWWIGDTDAWPFPSIRQLAD